MDNKGPSDDKDCLSSGSDMRDDASMMIRKVMKAEIDGNYYSTLWLP